MSIKSFLSTIFKIAVIIIALFIIAVIALAIWFWVADPYDLKQFLKTDLSDSKSNEQMTQTDESTDKHPLLDTEQEKTLEKIGVDVEALPTEITPEMEACFREKLGDDRVDQIVSGEDEVGTFDYIKAGACLGQ
ncbi:MAG: hypothetical protein GF349_03625 [Candidatus Magasanikbacteria bacterium]|nr:hypothetical protein [Candidatus Magasanikbacteria bacterium]